MLAAHSLTALAGTDPEDFVWKFMAPSLILDHFQDENPHDDQKKLWL